MIKSIRYIHNLLMFIMTIGFSTLLLSGCISTGQRTNLPLELPKEFSKRGSGNIEKKWWLDFNDQVLSGLIETALKDNFTLLAAAERISEVRALATQANAALFPSLDGSGSITTGRNLQAETTTDNFSLDLAALYEIDLWGRVRAVQQGAILDLKATEADYDTATISLAAEMATTWFELVENELQVELLKQQRETNKKVLELITTQFKTGKTNIADVLQQRQLVESNSGNLAGLRSKSKLYRHQLAILLGISPGSKLPETTTLPHLSPLPDPGVPITLISRRPDVRQSYFLLQAADSRVAAAVADRLPRLSISAKLSTSGDNAGDIFNNWFTSLGANLFSPIIDGGKRLAEVERQKAVARQQFYRYGQIILDALGEVETSLTKEEELQNIHNSLKIQLQFAEETIGHVGNRYRQGAEDYQRVLLALLSHQNLEREILQSHLQLINNRIALYRSLCGRIPADIDNRSETARQTVAEPQIITPINTPIFTRGSN